MATRTWGWVLSLAAIAACGDDTGSHTPADAGDDAATGDASSGGTSGTSGGMSANTGGTSGTTGGTTSQPAVMCGGQTCQIPGAAVLDLVEGLAAGLGFAIPGGGAGLLPVACCTGDDECGLIAGAECVAPPESDPRCPDVDFLGTPIASCCIEADNLCGANMAQFGGGCEVPFGGLGELFGMSAMACEAVDQSLDGGTDDLDSGL